MCDPPKPAAGPGPKPWVAGFVLRLSLIAWGTAILTELLPPNRIESACILIGSQAALLGQVTCLAVGLRYREGVFLLLFLLIAAPSAYFAVVVKQVAQFQSGN